MCAQVSVRAVIAVVATVRGLSRWRAARARIRGLAKVCGPFGLYALYIGTLMRRPYIYFRDQLRSSFISDGSVCERS